MDLTTWSVENWIGAYGALLATVLAAGELVRKVRNPVRVTVVMNDLLDSNADGNIVVHNRRAESIYVWRVAFVNEQGAEDVVIGDGVSTQVEVGARQRQPFRIGRAERRLRKARRLVVELSTGRKVVVRRRTLYRATGLYRLEQCMPRRSRAKWWLDKNLPGAKGRAAKRVLDVKATVRATFMKHLDAVPPTLPWPHHEAAQNILEMMYIEDKSDSDYRPFSEVQGELRAVYEERLAKAPRMVDRGARGRALAEHLRRGRE